MKNDSMFPYEIGKGTMLSPEKKSFGMAKREYMATHIAASIISTRPDTKTLSVVTLSVSIADQLLKKLEETRYSG